MICGIYKLYFEPDRFYIGSSIDVELRIKSHRRELKRGTHKNIILQRAWDKHGEDKFLFEVVKRCKRRNLLRHEQALIEQLDPAYNILKKAERSGVYEMSAAALAAQKRGLTPEVKAKMSKLKKEYWKNWRKNRQN